VTVHLFVTEPVLKFMTMYVLTLSLDVESVIDVLVVNAAVNGICYVIFSSHSELFDAIVGFLITVLLIFHLTRLVLRVMKERKGARFVVE
jgi:NAD(P)-dependent dehydrogenase (short-subunit alcohol dehydrogenase family)